MKNVIHYDVETQRRDLQGIFPCNFRISTPTECSLQNPYFNAQETHIRPCLKYVTIANFDWAWSTVYNGKVSGLRVTNCLCNQSMPCCYSNIL